MSRTETAITTIAHPEPSRVSVGVATHGEVQVACAIDQLGRRLAIADFQLVLEVNRPDRSARRRRAKSDPVDAEAAARAVLAGQVTAIPKTGSHLVEMVRTLRVARTTAVKARSQAVNALRAWWSPPRPSSASSCGSCPPPSWPARPRASSLARS